MSIALDSIRHATGGRLTLEDGQSTAQNKGLSLFGRLRAAARDTDHVWNRLRHGSDAQQHGSIQFKQAFFAALVKSEGLHVARCAAAAHGLPTDWASKPDAMSAKTCRQIMNTAEHLRSYAMRQADAAAESFAGAPGSTATNGLISSTGGVEGRVHSLATMLNAMDRHDGGGEPRTHAAADLKALFLHEVKRDPLYGTRPLGAADLTRIAQNTVKLYNERAAGRLAESHPGLEAFHGLLLSDVCRPDTQDVVNAVRIRLNTTDATSDGLPAENAEFRTAAREALNACSSNAEILREMTFTSAGWQDLAIRLSGRIHDMQDAVAALEALPNPPATTEGKLLQEGLVIDLRHQEELLKGKLAFVNKVAETNPSSEAAIAYSDRLWAEAGAHILRDVRDTIATSNPQAAARLAQVATQMTTSAAQRLNRMERTDQNISHAWEELATVSQSDVQRLRRDLARNPRDPNLNAEHNRLNALRVVSVADREVIETRGTRTNLRPAGPEHPALQAKSRILETLRTELEQAGLPAAEVDRLTGDRSVGDARRRALNENQAWAPVQRDMVVQKNGVTRTYQSVITPARNISPRFERSYDRTTYATDGAPTGRLPGGVSSATKGNHYHARNLKVSELHRADGTGHVTKMIGHGVLDMWDIADADLRKEANERGAAEVIEAALATNDRVLATAHARRRDAAGGPVQPILLTHVSVNLVTPSPIREYTVTRPLVGLAFRKDMTDYQELTYTKEQFRAFEAVSTGAAGAAREVLVADPDDPNRDVAVAARVDTIAFSFAINSLATGTGGAFDVVSGWGKVYEDNRGAMERFIGDLGSRETGVGSEGARPGGFIGSIYSRVDPSDPAQVELASRLRRQTNIVRDLFVSEDFRRGRGDPAKMSREILALQSLAEEALSVMKVDDQAATMSKGCKSDKDRGGVTDVEIKHKLITEEMGGIVVPDARLAGDDQDNYYVVAASSGQFENQQLNTGLMGSKEAGHLKLRIPDAAVRSFLAGLGKFASE
ncbi:inositol phosphate phosphatase SopB [Aureimonas jatrophae]|uniref:Phosphatidylinositol-4,5-bisphosphate 4-phosphatase n=1 Tax=Aureimonas jatrophae TaxID=1166073 RepID=A0A1H0NJB9_9HYPH|nr:inositol phosphate phosphatase SopB [Aureimonas jatrophae]MBB3948926.1 phosphatidylinositol-4,5-bisphosphate 4-phosphatase [Aureimonas jatrophae]SDO92784.1 phosphatidylinositol-4,5-bisphosphate 4-phosphatase [Aureimonas jatrophae]